MGDAMADDVQEESTRMPGWKIGVIILSIVLAIVLLYKFYKRWKTKNTMFTCCCWQGQQPQGPRRTDTAHRQLIRNESGGSDDGFVGKEDSSQTMRGKPEMV